MKVLYSLLLLCATFSVNAQHKTTPYFLINAGYTNWNGNFGKLGADLYLIQQNDNIIDFSAVANMGYMRDKFVVIPEVSVGYMFNFYNKAGDPYSDNFRSSFYTVGANISPWTISPEVGFAVLSIVEFNAGYAFQFRDYNDFKPMDGFRFGLTLHLPPQLFAD